MIIKMSETLAVSVQKRAECVTWNNETKPVTQAQRNYCGKNRRAPPSRNLILRWVQNSQNSRTVETQGRPGRPLMTSVDRQ